MLHLAQSTVLLDQILFLLYSPDVSTAKKVFDLARQLIERGAA